ncbi:MAG: DNA polymerase III subunit gamma/tau [Pirellulales bacterium]
MDEQSETVESAGEYVVIARRYRPQSFGELVGQQHVARALEQAITSDRVGHAYLFTGARGVGKTSAARILAKALNCVKGPTPTPCNECDVCRSVATGDDVDVLEIDGASNRGIDEIRQLRQNVSVRPSRARFKIYIIDEVHMLTKEAFNALLKTLEEPPEHVKFIFATTEANKIPITILSRCQRFDFAGIDMGSIQSRLTEIAAREGVEIEPEAAQILASRAAGSMRDSQSLLEQLLSVAEGKVTSADVHMLLGTAPVERLSGLVHHLANRDAAAALAELDAAVAGGVEVGQLLDQLIGYFRDVMAVAVGCGPQQMLYALPSQAAEVAAIGKHLGLPTILAMVQILDQTAARLRVSLHGRTLVEMAIVRISSLEDLEDLASLVAELRGEAPAAQASPRAPLPLIEPAKKNIEPVANVASLGTIPSMPQIAEPAKPASTPQTTTPSTEDSETKASIADPAPSLEAATAPELPTNGAAHEGLDSVLKQFQLAVEAKKNAAVESQPAALRVSRRQQAAEQAKAVVEQPFVKRALELFDVGPGQFRYTPPNEE